MNVFYIPEPQPPKEIAKSLLTSFDIEIDQLIGASRARSQFRVSGAGLCAAVLDTGLRSSHECFAGRVVPGRNFTAQDGGDPARTDDHNGHGTNVAGLIAAGTDDERRGIAPAARIVPLKVLPGGFDGIVAALTWVRDADPALRISVANLSLGVPGLNFDSDTAIANQMPELVALLAQLREMRIAVVIAAGNDYYSHQREGMSVPAILRQCLAVGAVYDASVGPRSYQSGATAYSTQADHITPFTQRLSIETSADCYTDIFAPGAAATSAGHASDTATSVQDGTSQAAPTVAGVILLMQELHLRLTQELPSIDLISDCLRSSAQWIVDGDDEDDNVVNTGRRYPRVDAFRALATMHKRLQLEAGGIA